MKRNLLSFSGLLFGGLLALALLTAPASAQTRTNLAVPKKDPHQWETAIKAYEAGDKTNKPPRQPIVFVGSSSIRLWKSLTNDFSDWRVLNRGFGGSEIADSVRYCERLVLKYHPKAVVFYAGDNDLGAGKSPEVLLSDFKRFVYKIHWGQPKVKIFFVSVKPSPSRWRLKDKVIETNRLVREYCDAEKNLEFVDVFPDMLGSDGLPRPEIFLKDNLHMNEKGYAIWTAKLKPLLEEFKVAKSAKTGR